MLSAETSDLPASNRWESRALDASLNAKQLGQEQGLNTEVLSRMLHSISRQSTRQNEKKIWRLNMLDFSCMKQKYGRGYEHVCWTNVVDQKQRISQAQD